MDNLALQKCEACRKDSPHATEDEIATYMPEISRWKILEINGVKRLERTYTFKDFVSALAFTNRVGELAEEVGHHPALLTEWGKVTVGWWTHKIRGLHRNDFICAAKTDALFASGA